MANHHHPTPLTYYHHHLRKMTGRDPDQPHRAATPMELLYDLTLVVAFGVAGGQFAHALSAGHIAVGMLGFQFVIFGAIWAWINFSWFASAYDTDDWYMRIAVLVQMAGVLLFALGIPDMFHGLEDGWKIHNEVIVMGYVVMRIPVVALWFRAARNDPQRRSTCLTYAIGVLIAQAGWIAIVFLHLPTLPTIGLMLVMFMVELGLPYIAETKHSSTPWHPHHIAERYGLLTIIALGEGIIGTTSALEALVAAQGWTLQVAVVLAAGLSLTFGCWWMYFNVPFGELLEKNRAQAFAFGYGHIILYTAIAAIGAGLHVAAYAFQGETQLGDNAVLITVAAPVALFIAASYMISAAVQSSSFTRLHAKLLVITALLLLAALAVTASGAGLSWGLMIVMLAPWVSVIGYEVLGYKQHNGECEN